MFKKRPNLERGITQMDWLKSYHSFSFAEYYDPNHMGFSFLRVVNEDFIEGGKGFETHPHRDMEIVTFIIKGSLKHKDSMGNESVIREGEVQRMTAGSGVMHSEFNNEQDLQTHLLQIWIRPKIKGLNPEYEQKSFQDSIQKQNFIKIVSPNREHGSLKIHQDAHISLLRLDKDLHLNLDTKRKYWLQIYKGSVLAGKEELHAGDGLKISDETQIIFSKPKDAHLLFFDLPA